MLEALKKEANIAYTENGAVSLRSSGKDCLDLFAGIGALRHADEAEIISRFIKAYSENADLAMKILFYARDIRGGLGERRVFRSILRWLAENEKQSVLKNLGSIAEFGRWDDMLVLLDTPCCDAALEYMKARFEKDLAALEIEGEVSLLAKWLPSANASNPETVRMAKRIIKAFGMKETDYRKALSRLRAYIRIIENNLREKDYSFDYSKQPSKAMFKYRRAFYRNDEERYMAFLDSVDRGEAKLNTGTLMPYEIVEKVHHGDISDHRSLDVTWKALENFCGDENALVVADGSGSMYWGCNPTPASVAQSLAIYFAERNRGAFRNHFITFSTFPQLVEIKGEDIVAKVRYCEQFNEIADTNLEAVFEMLLAAVVKYKLPQEELPEKLYIISDMEFNSCVRKASLSNFENAKARFAQFGCKLPQIVFWNVASRAQQIPVRCNEAGVALVSGCSPRIFSMVMSGETDPYSFMLSVINTERYAGIAA